MSPLPPDAAPAEPRRFARSIASVRNVAASYAGTAAESAAFLVLTPFLLRRLGLATYGLWSLGTALTDWLQLFDLGLREAILKFVAAHQARSDAPAVKRLADTALFLYSLIAVLALVTGLGLAWLALPLLVHDPLQLVTVRWVVILLGISAVISFPAGTTGTLLEGLARFDLINVFRVGNAALRVILIVLALQFDWGLIGVAAAELLSRSALHACRWAALGRIAPSLLPVPRIHRGDLYHLLGFGFWTALGRAADIAAARMYEPILAALAGLPAVGAFYAGRRLASTSAEVVSPMAGVLLPLSSEMDAAGRRSALRQTLLTSTKAAFLVGLPISLVLGIGAGPILTNWLGGRAPEAESVLMVFSFVFLIVAVFLPAEAMLLGMGHARLLALVCLAQVSVAVGLGVPLTRTLGPVGLALSTLAGVGLVQATILIPLAARRCGLPLGQLARRALLPPLIAGAPAALILLWLRDRVAIGGLAALAVWAAAGLSVYVLILWRIGFDREERTMMRSQLNRLILDPARVTDWEDTL